MKKKHIWLGSLAALAMMFTACGDDYLQTYPQSSLSSDEAAKKIEYCKLLVNGVYKTMSEQYYSTQGENGEGTTKVWFNSFPCGFSQRCNNTGWSGTINGTNHEKTNNAYTTYRWGYYYKMIMNANNAIETINEFDPGKSSSDKSKKEFYLGQVHTLRAYAYMQLLQLFSHRWQDSNNGQSRGVVLRTTTSTEEMPCSTQADVYAQIYKDLDMALEYFESSDEKREENWQINADVAHAIYSRAALYREDWATSAEHSRLARADYPLMGTEEYWNGFCTVNDEWIWSLYSSEDETLYYYGYFAYCASNGSSGQCNKYPFAIDKILYDKIPDEDSRKTIYIAPTEAEVAEGYISTTNGQAKKGSFYKRAWADYGQYLNVGSYVSYIFAYMQVKVRLEINPGIGQLNLARAAEMYYNEAESEYKLGNYAKAAELLEEVVKPYNPGYTCDLTGEALFEEIKKYRIFDLLLEGYTYFDEKRWKQDRVRVSIKDGGNWHATFAGIAKPEDHNYWTLCIPQFETDYNQYINHNVEPDNWSINDETTW